MLLFLNFLAAACIYAIQCYVCIYVNQTENVNVTLQTYLIPLDYKAESVKGKNNIILLYIYKINILY